MVDHLCTSSDNDGSGTTNADGHLIAFDRTNRSIDEAEKGKPPHVVKPKAGSDEPFGDETNSEVKYRTMHWWQAGMIMIAETISLGILSLPSALAAVGLMPGIILIAGLGIIATYTGYVLGQFKLAHPQVHSMADAGFVLAGPIGREIVGAGQIIFLIFVMGSHILTFSIMMNTVTNHGTCTIVFGVVGLLISFTCTTPRTLRRVSFFAIVSFVSIISAVLITMIGVGVETPGLGKVDAIAKTTLRDGFLAVTNIIFAYAGHVTFFSFISELHTPEEYTKALFLLQGVDTGMYLIVAIVIYRFAGANVASPALGSTSPFLRKIAYGIAIPTIIVSGVINGHVAAKYIYVRAFRGTDRMSKKSWSSFGIWAAIVLVLWVIAWIIAEAIPVFNDLLGLISALFASWFTYGLSGVFWLCMNKGRYGECARKKVLTGVNSIIFCMGAIICGLGLYASGVAIHANESSTGAFACADNSKLAS